MYFGIIFRVTKVCQKCLSVYPLHESLDTGKVEKESVGWVVYSCVLSVLRVLLNLTHDNGKGDIFCYTIATQGITSLPFSLPAETVIFGFHQECPGSLAYFKDFHL